MAYRVRIEKRVAKDLRRIPQRDRQLVARAIDGLASNPRPPGVVKLRNGTDWRIRVGNYRIRYRIEDDVLLVLVVRVGHRREIIDDLSRRGGRLFLTVAQTVALFD